MSLVKPDNISGLNSGHSLNANIKQFLVFGTTNKDLTDDSDFTNGGTASNIETLGDCTYLTNGGLGASVDLEIANDNSVVFIYQHNGVNNNTAGDAAKFVFCAYVGGGNQFEVSYRRFSTAQYKVIIRADFAGPQENRYNIFPTVGEGAVFHDPHAIALTSEPENSTLSTQVYFDGSLETQADGGVTNNPYSSSPLSVPLFPTVGASGGTYVSAAIVFDKVLTPTEFAEVTTTPWAMVEVVETPAVTTTDTLQPGSTFTLTATNYASAPASPVTLTDSQGSTITVPVTISGTGPYTVVGTMPTLAEAVTAGTSLLFGNVTIELST